MHSFGIFLKLNLCKSNSVQTSDNWWQFGEPWWLRLDQLQHCGGESWWGFNSITKHLFCSSISAVGGRANSANWVDQNRLHSFSYIRPNFSKDVFEWILCASEIVTLYWLAPLFSLLLLIILHTQHFSGIEIMMLSFQKVKLRYSPVAPGSPSTSLFLPSPSHTPCPVQHWTIYSGQ